MSTKVEWIAVDWGTSNVRAWGISSAGDIVFACESDQGMGRITKADYSAGLQNLIIEHLDTSNEPLDVVICGMAGAKQGWCEAPYLETPANLRELGKRAVTPDMQSGRLHPRILSGICQNQPGEEDVMRGEETQILGLLALKPDFTGTICMPGTHSKWVKVEGGKIISFSTAMTGELYELLSTHAVLRHSLQGELTGPHLEEGVAAGLAEGIKTPQLLTSNLFKVRAAALLSEKTPDWCAGYLSGLLVGAEVASHKQWISDTPVPLIGSARLCRLYTTALTHVGAKTETIDATSATLAGLTEARKQMQ